MTTGAGVIVWVAERGAKSVGDAGDGEHPPRVQLTINNATNKDLRQKPAIEGKAETGSGETNCSFGSSRFSGVV